MWGISSAINSGETIKLVLGKFINPMTAGSDSFRIQSFADDDFKYLVDRLMEGMVPGIQCELPCLGCLGES
jgi:hypothetical protein